MGQVARPQHSLRFESTGQGAPAWLCLHGLVDRLEIWDRVAGPLSERGRMLRYDQRGHGRSTAPPGPCTREDLASDAIAVLDEAGVGRAILVGHSMGGIVAMTTALAHPNRVAGLVLIGTASRCNERVAGWYERIARAGERDGLAGLGRAIYGERSTKQIAGDAAGIAAVTRMLASLHEDPLTPKLPAIRCPALLLVGEKDPMGPRASEIIAEGLSNATLRVIPDCGHWVHVDEPDASIAAIDASRFEG